MKRFFLSFCLILLFAVSNGQSIRELRAKKTDAEKQIQYTSSLLEETRKNEQASLSRLKLLKSQIQNRNTLIANINSEIELVDWSISNNSEIISMLQEDLSQLKSEYAAMIRFAQKNKNSFDVLIYLFSADNVNQAYKRWLYLRQYTHYRRIQADMINLVSVDLDKNVSKLHAKKQSKTDLLNAKLNENRLLDGEKNKQASFIQSLQKQQQDLSKKIKEQQRIQEELNRQIQKMLEEEARKTADKSGFGLTPEQKLVSADFEKNKGRIPWPVERGVITEHFGIHAHAVLKQIQVRSNGIDISTAAGAKARAVFAGDVSRVFAISGSNMAVIIRHGDFLSVYSNLSEVSVKAGQKVSLKQEIGTIYTDVADGNTTVLKFQIWKENQKLDPEDWISLY